MKRSFPSLDTVWWAPLGLAWPMNQATFRIRRRFGLEPPLIMATTEDGDSFLAWSERRGNRPQSAMRNNLDASYSYKGPGSVRRRFAATGSLNEGNRYSTYAPEQLRQSRFAYDAEISHIDKEIGRIVDAFSERDRLDRRIPVVLSDHGGRLDEENPQLPERGTIPYDETIDVPLLIRSPLEAPAGVRVAMRVGMRSLAATNIDPIGDRDSSVTGAPLTNTLVPGADTSPSSMPRSVRASGHPLPHEPVARGGPTSSAGWLRWHCGWSGDGNEEVFDIERDTWEGENRVGESGLESGLQRVRASVPRPDRWTVSLHSSAPGAVLTYGIAGND